MAINKKLIHFNNKSTFNTQKVSANSINNSYRVGGVGTVTSGAPDIKYQSIVFIKDTQEIWTHDKFYPCPFTKSELQNLLNGKVDKVTGKGLSTNDFTNNLKAIIDYYNTERNRYLSLSFDGITYNTGDITLGTNKHGPIDDLENDPVTINSATTSKAGVMSAEDKTNLDTLTRWSKDELGDIIDTGHTSDNVELYLKQAFTNTYSTAIISSATTTEAGVMSSSDKKYLDSIKGLGVIGTAGLGFSTDASVVYLDYDGISSTGTNISGSIDIPAATTTDAGVMTAADKQDLNNIKSTINNLSTTYLPLSGGQMMENATVGFSGTNNQANYNINGVSLTDDNYNRCTVSSNIIRVFNSNNEDTINITPASIYIGNSGSEVSTTLSYGNIKIENSVKKSYSNITPDNITVPKVISNSADIKTINSTTSITTPTLTTTREIVCGDASEDNVNITKNNISVNDYSTTGNNTTIGAGYIQLYEDTDGIDVTLTASNLKKLLALIK